jgi:hypothetical protein
MIIGAHSIIYSKNAEADRRFLLDVMGFPSVDAGGGWLIFALPPSEVAIHPSRGNDRHEFYLMCDNIQGFVRLLRKKKIECSPIHEEQWGSLVQVVLPGGGKLGVYQPKHARPLSSSEGLPREKTPTGKAKAAKTRRERPAVTRARLSPSC